jgi:hypothetical protein
VRLIILGQTFGGSDSVCSMNPKEDPQDFIQLSYSLDFVQAVVLLFSTKTSLHAGCPFLAEFTDNDLHMLFMISGPNFSFEVCCDFLTGIILPVGMDC